MRFAQVRTKEGVKPAVLHEDQLVLVDDLFEDLSALVAGGDASIARCKTAQAEAGRVRVPSQGADLAAPIRRFNRDVLCTGWNYWDHFEEGHGRRDGQEVERPKAPTFFTKSPNAIIGPRDDIAYDGRVSKKWDYEAEIAMIIGKPGLSIPASQAHDHIFGYCLANDVSQRELQRRHGGQWMKGKSADQSTPLGPMIVTPDELDIPETRIECHLNDEKMQSALVKQMAFPIEDLIAELSFGMTLNTGDVILTGTPAGVGNGRTPQVFMKAGDEVVVSATGLGELRNTLKDVDLYQRSGIEI